MTMAFKYLLVTVLLIAQNVLGQDTAPPSTSDPDPDPTPPDMPQVKCAAPGFMCSDCNHQAICIGATGADGNVEYNQIQTKCPKDTFCLNSECNGTKCNYRPFKCSDSGFYPNPYLCTDYHVCMWDEGNKQYQQMDMKCGEGRGSYDAASGSCGFPMNSTSCMLGPLPRCAKNLQVGVLKTAPSIYYICIDDGNTIAANLFRCTGGKEFDIKKISCVDKKKKK